MPCSVPSAPVSAPVRFGLILPRPLRMLLSTGCAGAQGSVFWSVVVELVDVPQSDSQLMVPSLSVKRVIKDAIGLRVVRMREHKAAIGARADIGRRERRGRIGRRRSQ